jgi:Arc/MetJ family transcription regulator
MPARRQRYNSSRIVCTKRRYLLRIHTHNSQKVVYDAFMGRTNIVLDDDLVRKARKLTRLKTKREIVNKALELLVRSESRKGILRYYGTGIWKGDLKRMRRNRT